MKRLAIIAAVLLALVVTASAIIEAYGEATSAQWRNDENANGGRPWSSRGAGPDAGDASRPLPSDGRTGKVDGSSPSLYPVPRDRPSAVALGQPLAPDGRRLGPADREEPTLVEARTAALGAMVAAQRLRGVASWYATPGLTGAAGPVLRDALGGDPAFRGERVTVCSEACVTVTLSDWCRCPERGGQPTLIDLSDSAFERLAPLSRGIASVTVAVDGPEPMLPATSTEAE